MNAMPSNKAVKECIELTTQCANICVETIPHCLQKGGAHVATPHMKLLMDCAEICRTCDGYLLRNSEFMGRICGLCAEVCQRCSDSCASFAGDKMMQDCADACRRMA